jgi:hypothetical protein
MVSKAFERLIWVRAEIGIGEPYQILWGTDILAVRKDLAVEDLFPLAL